MRLQFKIKKMRIKDETRTGVKSRNFMNRRRKKKIGRRRSQKQIDGGDEVGANRRIRNDRVCGRRGAGNACQYHRFRSKGMNENGKDLCDPWLRSMLVLQIAQSSVKLTQLAVQFHSNFCPQFVQIFNKKIVARERQRQLVLH